MLNTAVVHNASNQRFEIDIDGQLSILEHTFKNHRQFLTHTEVRPAPESQGLARSWFMLHWIMRVRTT